MNKTSILIGLLAFAMGIGAAQYYLSRQAPAMSAASDEGGTLVPVADGKFGGDFTLMQGDKPVKLSDFQGKLVLMYFGYTSCPDVCPTSLSVIAAGLKQLTPEELAQVQPIFISVDPERDNGEKLMNYATYFHPSFIGLTGSPEDVLKVSRQYGAFFAKVQSDSAMGYLIDHTSNSYLVSKDGQYVKILPHDMNKDDVAKNIRQAL
ncbi:MAG: SCO family protein [Gammaproteobacteria bacterium]|nr:SCO family protein [Gammaproteobacteria bacterium]MBU1725039.1 SCO family protein [Gammaproteobacteria bacterium]MBU2006473.1 SCO family protein [Gammaproteobacteria bacterium]